MLGFRSLSVIMDFALVEFTQDSTVAVAPTLWYTEESHLCYWPPYKGDRLTRSIKKVEQPSEQWKSYSVRVLHYYESYNAARQKLRQAEETSALDTEADEVATKREKHKRVLTDEDDDIEPDTPVVSSKKVKKQRSSCHTKLLPAVPASLESSDLSENLGSRSGNSDNTARIIEGSVDQPNKSPINDIDCTHNSETPETAPVIAVGIRKSPRTSIHKSPRSKTAGQNLSTSSRKSLQFCETPMQSAVENRRQTNSASSTSKASQGPETTSQQMKAVMSRLAVIEAHQRQHTVLLQHILSALEKHDEDESCDVPDGISLPVNSLKDIRNLEATLQDEAKAKQLLCAVKARYLGSVGGKDVPDTTRRTMRTLMTNALALRMNFDGRGEKVGISDMTKILNVIIRAVKRNRLCRKATRDDVETTVKLWLRYASDRAGGRNRRSQLPNKKRAHLAAESADSASD